MTKVVSVDLDRPLSPIDVEPRHRSVLLVVSHRGLVVGEVALAATPVVDAERQRAAIEQSLGDALRLHLLRLLVAQATRGRPDRAGRPPAGVSVIVDAAVGGEGLRRCLASLRGLHSPAARLAVIDRTPRPQEVRACCRQCGADYVRAADRDRTSGLERALGDAQGELVAFTSDRSVVDPAWLDRLDEDFQDPLTVGVVGYSGPAELETSAQLAGRPMAGAVGCRRVLCGATIPPQTAATAPVRTAASLATTDNLVLRRKLIDAAGGLVLDRGRARTRVSVSLMHLLYQALNSGYRLVLNPSRVVWVTPSTGLRQLVVETFEASASRASFAAYCLGQNRDPDAVRLLSDCIRGIPPSPPRDPSSRLRRPLRIVSGLGGWAGSARYRRARCRALPSTISLPPVSATRPSAPSPSDQPACASLVVPSYNRREALRRLLEGLREQTHPSSRFEVVVVIDGSTDGSAEMVRRMRLPYRCRVLERANHGVAASRNAGVREAKHDLIIHLDDDMVPAASFVEEHVRAHGDGRRSQVCIGYAAAVLEGQSNAWAVYQRAAWEDHYRRKEEPDHPWTYFDFSVGNSSLHRSLLDAIGGFDEGMRRHDDQESGVRLVRAGADFVYRREALTWHHFEVDLATNLAQIRAQAEHDVALATRHPHLKSQLAAGGMARTSRSGLSPRATLAFRLGFLSERMLAAGSWAATALERLRLRRSARGLAYDLSAVAYVRGLRDTFGNVERFRAFIAPIWNEPPVATLEVDLASRSGLTIPPEGGRVQLRLLLSGSELACLDAQEAAREWSWDELIERGANAVLGPSRRAATLDQLLHLAAAA